MSRSVIRYHPAVPDDIVEITNYLRTQSSLAAYRFPRAVRNTIHIMSRRPLSASVLEFDSDPTDYHKTSIVSFPNHLLVYRPIPSGIRVIAVVHGSRDLRRFLRGRN